MSLKIYFCGSIGGGRDDAALYLKIVNHLKEKYGKVLSEHVADPNVIANEGRMKSKAIHDRDVDWLKSADVIVAEVTQVSMGVGYELGFAMAIGKPVLALHRHSPVKILSCMVDGAHNGTTFTVKKYLENEVYRVIDEYFASLKK